MKTIFDKLSITAAFLTCLMGFVACSGPDDLVESIDYKRPFTPTELEAKVQNTTNVKLSWECLSADEEGITYIVELYADDADMTFTGSPDTYTTDKSPFTITELQGETSYSVRVKSIRSDGTESAWAKATFETGTEQILQTPTSEEIGKTWVTLTWLPAGTSVTTITVVKNSEVIQTINLTAEQITAGQCTVEGLDMERTYTFYLYNGEKQRGKMQVTTLPNYTPVTDCKELLDAIAAAEPDEVIMLTEKKVYDFTEYTTDEGNPVTSIKINQSVAIKSNAGATIKGIYFQLNGGATFEIASLTLDGTGGTGDQAFAYKEAGNYGRLYIHDCEIMNYTKGFFYINVAAVIDDITITGCIIHDIVCSGGDMFDSRSGGFNKFNLTNNTIYNSAASRDFIRMDDASGSVAATPVINVDHNTLYNVGAGAANYRLLYVRFAGNQITWTNNVVSGTNYKRGFSNQKTTAIPTFKNNFYHNTANLVNASSTADGTIQFFDNDTYDGNGVEITDNPFADPANADFTIINEKIKDVMAGDPRWITE